MAIIKCKMCGGDLQISEGMTVAECEYCGTKQTVPNVDNEKKLTLFSRANRLRLACEFDKAAGVYESIVAEFPEEAEAYWGLVLCRYGIEYVDDPATGKKIPTCHRSSFDSILEDSDFDQACENADAAARRVYRDEAKQIEEIRKGILEVSGKEEPYDIFICYKETDENGARTLDSVLAQDVYDALTGKGYRVFFSRITLEDKLGQEYEPYIFAALNSAKIMLVVGTDYEYFHAVWVKNEWSRFLKLMEKDKTRHLIPCYKGVDAYDMPKEFARLQAQDLGKVGAIQDLLRGVEKLIAGKQEAAGKKPETAYQSGGPTVNSLLKRGQMFLMDGDWNNADQYFDKVLDIDPESAEAYLGKFCAERRYHTLEACVKDVSGMAMGDNRHYQKAVRFGSEELRKTLQKFEKDNQEIKKETSFQNLCARVEKAHTEEDFKALAKEFGVWSGYQDADLRRRMCEREIEKCQEKNKRETEWRKKYAAAAQNPIAAGKEHTVGLKADGTVVAAGRNKYGQCSVDDWSDITAIASEDCYSVGLKADGTVVAAGKNDDGQCDVSKWSDVAAVSAGSYHTVALKADGTVVAVGDNQYGKCGVGEWSDTVAIAAGDFHTIGLKADGTVVAVGRNYDGQCDVSGWSDIVAVVAGTYRTVGLKSDGTVVAAGKNDNGQCGVTDWTGIVSIAAGSHHTVGLQMDGTVVAAGSNEYGQCDVSNWTNIVAIAAGSSHTVGVKTDGTVVAAGSNEYGQCNVRDWKLFDDLTALEQAWEERRRQEEERKAARRAALEQEKEALSTELANLKGIFSILRRREIESRLDSIAEKMKQL